VGERGEQDSQLRPVKSRECQCLCPAGAYVDSKAGYVVCVLGTRADLCCQEAVQVKKVVRLPYMLQPVAVSMKIFCTLIFKFPKVSELRLETSGLFDPALASYIRDRVKV